MYSPNNFIERDIFVYLSHGLGGPTECCCGDDTHCSSSVISSFKGLVCHLDDTICHLQNGDNSTGEGDEENKKYLENNSVWSILPSRRQAQQAQKLTNKALRSAYLICRFVYHIYIFPSAKPTLQISVVRGALFTF